MRKALIIGMLCTLLSVPSLLHAQEDDSLYRTLIEQLYENVYNDGDTQLINALVAEEYVDHGQPRWSTRADIAYIVHNLHNRLPDLQVTIQSWYFKGDLVAVEVVFNGTLDGYRRTMWALIDIYRIEDDKIAEAWHVPLDAEYDQSPRA